MKIKYCFIVYELKCIGGWWEGCYGFIVFVFYFLLLIIELVYLGRFFMLVWYVILGFFVGFYEEVFGIVRLIVRFENYYIS